MECKMELLLGNDKKEFIKLGDIISMSPRYNGDTKLIRILFTPPDVIECREKLIERYDNKLSLIFKIASPTRCVEFSGIVIGIDEAPDIEYGIFDSRYKFGITIKRVGSTILNYMIREEYSFYDKYVDELLESI